MENHKNNPLSAEVPVQEGLVMQGSDGATAPQMDPIVLEKLASNGRRKAHREEAGMTPWRANRLLRTFESHEQTRLFNSGRWMTYKPNEVISRQAADVVDILFIVEGKARAEISSPQANSRIAVVNLLGPGDDIGLLSLVDGAPHSATVTALTELRAVAVPFQELRERLIARPDRYQVLAEIAVERLRLSGGWLQALI